MKPEPQRLRACSAPVLLILAAMLLSACSIVPDAPPVQLLDPRPDIPAPAHPGVDWRLDVARPESDPVRDSTRVLVRTSDGRLQVQGASRWIAAPPDLLRGMLLRHIRDHAVTADAAAGGSGAEHLLAIDLRRFELDEAGDPRAAIMAVIVLEARLYQSPRYRMIDRRRFEFDAPLAAFEPGAINTALETALAGLIADLTDWLIRDTDSRRDAIMVD
ncbi:MAG: ABC-type transport auxiliary lipoprotein family protein [Wenzhouxiangellaceae bacterium]